MLTSHERATIDRVYDALATLIPGFIRSKQQRSMIDAGAEALATKRIAMIEAPTGVGKTAAYLTPGMVLAATRNRRLIVATATAALQDQIASKDIEIVSRAMKLVGIEVKWAVAKGRERYVCPLRLRDQAKAPELFDTDAQKSLATGMHEAISNRSWSGDRDAWSTAVPQPLWRQVSNSRHACLGGRCRLIGECPYFLAVNQAESSQVVIANHDLVLTSLARAEQSIFAEFDRNFYVFDEAHHLSDKALGAFASRATDGIDWAHDLPALLTRAGAGQFKKAAQTEIRALTALLASMRVSFDSLFSGKDTHRFKFGEVPAHLRAAMIQTKSILRRLGDFIAAAEKATELEGLRLSLGIVRGQIETGMDGWGAFCTQDTGKPRARWIERDNGHYAAVTSPFDASGYLRRVLWDNCEGAILTSATLAPLGSFDSTLRSFGLYGDTRVSTVLLDSPFHYRGARIRIPKMRCQPEDVMGHTVEVAQQIRVVSAGADGGVLAIFASVRQLRDVLAMMSDSLRESILVQGDLGIQEILSRNRQRLALGQRSTIFGLASFAEGIDLPGNLCTRVIIAKLPFPSPDEPIIAAASEWLEQKGAKAFPIIILPRGAIRFTQTVGRLVRSANDWGEVIVLDRRLVTKSYGKRMLQSVPMSALVV